MATEREELAEEFTQVLEVGPNLYVVLVDPKTLHEQTINAQIMDAKEFQQLVDNISQRQQLESLPYCHRPPNSHKIEIVSGHHRVRAANAAELKEIPILLDTAPMSRSTLTAKQIAHNQLVGKSDEAVLRLMLDMIVDLDDLIMTGLPDDYLPVENPNNINILAPRIEFDWRTVTLTFLPERLDDFELAISSIEPHSELVGIAHINQFEQFSKAVTRYMGIVNIKNLSTAIAELTRIATQESDLLEQEQEETRPHQDK